MDHKTIKDNLFSVYDPETGNAERQEILSHCKTCDECRARMIQWDKLRQIFSKSDTLEASPSFVNSVMAHLPEKTWEDIPSESRNLFPQIKIPHWLLMPLGYGFAIILMFIAIVSRQTPVTAESILLADLPASSQWTVASETPNTDQIFSLSKEE